MGQYYKNKRDSMMDLVVTSIVVTLVIVIGAMYIQALFGHKEIL